MTPRTATPVPRLSWFRRFGPLTAVVVALALVAALASVGRDEQTVSAGGKGTTGQGAERSSDLPITYAEAKEDGTLSKYDFGENCDPKTGRVKVPSVYAAACVAAPKELKGGNTSEGVTAEAITVVLYEASDLDLGAQLQAKLDSQAKVEKTELAFLEMFQKVYNTWGRKIEVKRLKGSGIDETSARADALKVAVEIKAFASLGGPSQSPAYADVLASRGVLCLGCGLGVPDSTYQENAPYMWGPLQTPEQFLLNVGDYIIQRLLDRKAAHAGSAEFRSKKRVFGIVHFEQDPPVFTGVEKTVEKLGAERGFKAAANLSYQLIFDKLGEQARTIIAKLKGEGVTTVVFLGDPVMPINLTKTATEQNYFPEWIITGTVLTDTTTLGRLYDQKQWSNAFGVSSLGVPTDQKHAEGWRLHEWYFGRAPVASKTVPLIYEDIEQFMLGVHMAGPKLTPETFRGGMFKYPISGGGSATPRVSYGNHGIFDAKKYGIKGKPDYLAVDDMTEMWWDADYHGPDEQGVVGDGIVTFANGARRYLPGQMPNRAEDAFKKKDSVTRFDFDKLTGKNKPPTYPSPRNGG